MVKRVRTFSVVPAEEPGPIRRALSRGHRVWVPAFAGTTGGEVLERGSGRYVSKRQPLVYCAFAQAAMMGLLAGVRARQVADRSVGKVAAILVAPQ
jgi:hypothetical protein